MCFMAEVEHPQAGDAASSSPPTPPAEPARMREFPALSVLDLAPVVEGAKPGDALRNSVDLAQTVERLGYHRHWVAEHHNMPGIASSAPAVLAATLAAGDRADPRRLGRRDAPQPRAAGRRRAVRDARGAASRAASTSGSAARPAPTG